MNKNTYTVSQLTYTIKNLLEGNTSLMNFTLKGEISNFIHHRSGHLYFALKDENSQIRAIMFKGNASRLNFNPKDGDKVTLTGNINVYAPQGSYSVQVSKMELDGAGELYLKFLELKEKLNKLGWFDKEKKTIPKFPKNIGVITSPTGAVIKDITNTVNRRYRLTNIKLYPALVQGPSSHSSISKQINKANEDNICDVLIVGRGGGSIEDLWGFNELDTVTAIYNSKIPIITAIGHETDTTLSDFVSDLRAPTPTAAAELATPNTIDLVENLKRNYRSINNSLNNLITKHQTNLVYLEERLDKSGPLTKLTEYNNKLNNLDKFLNNYYLRKISNETHKLNTLTIKLTNLSPKSKLNESFNKLENIKVNMNKNYNYIIEKETNKLINLNTRSNNLFENIKTNKRNEFNNIKESLNLLNPLSIMERGYTVTKTKENKVLSSVKDVNINDKLDILFKDGNLDVKVLNVKEKNNGK